MIFQIFNIFTKKIEQLMIKKTDSYQKSIDKNKKILLYITKENMSDNRDSESQTDKQNSYNDADISRFKEKIAQIASLSSDFSVEKPKENDNDHVYRINITEYCKNDGVIIEYTKEIGVYEFSLVMDEIFGIDIDNFDDDYEDDVRVFGSLDEVIDYLQQNTGEEDK
jgi:hypothetical protein